MNNRRTILIVDTADSRREELARLWCELDCEVDYYSGGDWYRFGSGDEPRHLDGKGIGADACLFHASDGDLYQNEAVRNIIDRAQIVVVYSGGGANVQSKLPDKGLPIRREVRGADAASRVAWEQLRDWLFSESRESGPLPMLLAGEPRYLQALYILCEGCLAVLRAEIVPRETKGEVLSREWWSVPLLKGGTDLANQVDKEWIGEVPAEVAALCRWIAGEGNGAQFPREKLEDARVAIHKRLSC